MTPLGFAAPFILARHGRSTTRRLTAPNNRNGDPATHALVPRDRDFYVRAAPTLRTARTVCPALVPRDRAKHFL